MPLAPSAEPVSGDWSLCRSPIKAGISAARSGVRSWKFSVVGALKIVDGSVGSPAIKFNTDGTSGIYKTTNGFGVSIGGTKVVELKRQSDR